MWLLDRPTIAYVGERRECLRRLATSMQKCLRSPRQAGQGLRWSLIVPGSGLRGTTFQRRHIPAR